MIEHFKPAGHKAPTLTTAIALEETFKPIQRVTHKNKTIGYLFRDVEYRNGHVENVILASNYFLDRAQEPLYKKLSTWNTYLANEKNNPYGFRIPSGPLMMELTHRTTHDKGELRDEVNSKLSDAYNRFQVLNTIIDYTKNAAIHQHLTGKRVPQSLFRPERQSSSLSADLDIMTQDFLTTLLGRHASQTHKIYGQYGPVELWLPQENALLERKALVIGLLNFGSLIIAANVDIYGTSAAYCVADARNILNIPGVKVHDD